MITASQLSLHYGGKYLFDECSFVIGTRDRVGLVGKNGAGKSTLLKVITREIQPESGTITTPNSYRIGYLPQDGATGTGKTVYDETATVFDDILSLEHKIHDIADELGRREDHESEEYYNLVHELTEANEKFSMSGGHTIHADIERILQGLGFSSADLLRLTDEFSGGWQMRIELAKILLVKPDCILLDEPTNHLDIDSIQWLEQFLRNYDGSVMLVSHDRAFLDVVTNRTLEITRGEIEDYPASYSRYVEMRAERRAHQLSAFKNQQKEIAKTEEFIERFRYKASLATRVQSRVKMLEKVERIEVEEEDLSAIAFRFPPAPRSGLSVVSAKHLTKKYGEKTILRDIFFELGRGDRVAFVGKNGEGKTTFSKIIAGTEPYDGELIIGHNVAIGYYAQHQAEMLDGNASVFEIIDNAATGEMRTKIRSLLGAFLFSGDDVYKKVKVLSGGEKSRLALAKLLLQPSNLLILDEPTNHLDMRAKDVLKRALQNYDGALIVVSHDREFLQGLTGKVCEFQGGKIRETDGDIYEFLRLRQLENLRELEKNNPKKADKNIQENTPKPTSAPDREDRKKTERERRRLEREVSENEAEISLLENAVSAFEKQMSEPNFYSSANSADILEKYRKKRGELERKIEEWTALNEQLESMTSV